MTVEAIKNLLDEQKLDALLITSNPNLIYLTNFSHFSPFEREAYILLTKDTSYIFTDARYSESVMQHIPRYILREISGDKRLTDHILDITTAHNLTTVGLETTDIRFSEYTHLKKTLKNIKLIATKNVLENIRVTKSTEEVDKIKKACTFADQAFEEFLPLIKPGIRENELSFWIESYFRQHGADISFEPIVAFGAHAAIPHHGSGNLPLTTESVVLIDFGAKVENYCSDMTRTVFVKKPTNEEAKIYETVLASQQKAISSLKSFIINLSAGKAGPKSPRKTIKASAIDNTARFYITDQGYPSIPHALGHGMGIEVHEAPVISPRSKDILKPGMVFSIEPGIYIPGKIGVRIEDLVYLKEDGFEVLTKAPRELIVL